MSFISIFFFCEINRDFSSSSFSFFFSGVVIVFWGVDVKKVNYCGKMKSPMIIFFFHKLHLKKWSYLTDNIFNRTFLRKPKSISNICGTKFTFKFQDEITFSVSFKFLEFSLFWLVGRGYVFYTYNISDDQWSITYILY